MFAIPRRIAAILVLGPALGGSTGSTSGSSGGTKRAFTAVTLLTPGSPQVFETT
jgi:hypothetical protein